MDNEFTQPPKHKWPLNGTSAGLVAVILSAGVSIAMILTVMGALVIAIRYDRPMSGEAATLLATIFGTVVGAVATYLGQAKNQQEKSG